MLKWCSLLLYSDRNLFRNYGILCLYNKSKHLKIITLAIHPFDVLSKKDKCKNLKMAYNAVNRLIQRP